MFVSKLRFAMLLVVALVAVTAPGMFVSAQGQTRVFLPIAFGPPPPPPELVVVKSSRKIMNQHIDARAIVGEVVNNRATVVGGIRIIARFYDANDQLIPTIDGVGEEAIEGVQGGATLRRTRPGEVNPFWIPVPTVFTREVDRSSRYELEVQLDPIFENHPDYQRLTIVTSHITSGTENGTEVRGVVRNDSSKAVTFATVAATFYDPNGNVLDVAKINSDPENLEPGQSGQFFFTTREWSEGTGAHTFVAEGQVQR